MFYDPTKSYGLWGGTRDDAFTSPLGRRYANEQAPEGYWTRWLAERGYGGFDDRSDWARAQFNRAVQGFEAARTRNLDLEWSDYLDTLNLPGVYNQLSSRQKGIDDSRFTGRMNWQPR